MNFPIQKMTFFSLHTLTLHRCTMAINRLHIHLHFTAVLLLLYYRTTALHRRNHHLLWSLLTLAELLFAFVWLLAQSFRWRPVSRSVSPENLPGEAELPGVDVFICTADPAKEPTVEVMNTVLSCLALDYPAEKLAVYLSDDGGSPATYFGVKEAGWFAKTWVPFCSEYGINSICPEVYFSSLADEDRIFRDPKFVAQEKEIKKTYEAMKKDLERYGMEKDKSDVVKDRSASVKIILDGKNDGKGGCRLPLRVYVSRERRPSVPHRYKAGNINSLVRVSGLISNNPYLLVLDCDMHCNDPTSVKQAMCFYLDSPFSKSLGYVQFPQIFYNLSKNDIYDNQARPAFKTKWIGMNGLRGPVMSGTGYFLRRKALFGSPNQEERFYVEPHKVFGQSQKFIDSMKMDKEYPMDAMLNEAVTLASCSYEENTEWGKKIGFSYDCLLESTFTGYLLQCKGWTSAYLYPKRPCFLGSSPVDMKDAIIQMLKWSSELFQVGFSKYSPLIYGISRMSILQSMSYAYFAFSSLLSVAFVLYGVIPQWGFLKGIPLYPKLSDPWFAVFVAIFISSIVQHLIEVFSSGGNLKTWWNELRIWMVKSVSACLFGVVDAIMKITGLKKMELNLTNKAIDKEKLKKYEKGMFDLQGATILMAPLFVIALWNMICFVGGMRKVVKNRNFEEMFGQMFLLSFALVLHYPVLVGVMKRKGKSHH
ncbi:cellulose synthase-like protein G1 isoform X2 [Benincasa hispida]|uniref:cellulose synthase-like protein G1 isoform X2 n=1 Tax=Benincasa hispida TaxID=102211 RepID=UPI001902645F|nr:cellulose synthase-like protein G1 isoform X2 [Benincasa hispida]